MQHHVQMDHLCVHCFPPVLVSLCHGGRPEPVDPKETSLQVLFWKEEMKLSFWCLWFDMFCFLADAGCGGGDGRQGGRM